MNTLIEELHQDHLNLAKILKLLETNLTGVKSGEPIDLDMLYEVVEYVEVYPDQFHHPREDCMFTVYLENHGQHQDVIEQLMNEHKLLTGRTQQLRQHLQQWRQDSLVPRETIVHLMNEYLSLQWNHLNLEESEVFALLDSDLKTSDWERINSLNPVNSDPLFGGQPRLRFHYLYAYLNAL